MTGPHTPTNVPPSSSGRKSTSIEKGPDGGPPPSDASESEEARGAFSRWARRIGITVGVVVALVVVLLTALFFGEGPLHYALRKGVAIYTGMIPGEAEFESLEGSLADGLVVRGVHLRDAEGNELVEVPKLALAVHPFDGDRGSWLRVDLIGARVHLPETEARGFADLAPPGDDTPEEPETPVERPEGKVGPSLPHLGIELHIEDFELDAPISEPSGPSRRRSLVAIEHLDLGAGGADRDFTLALNLASTIPVADGLSVDALNLATRWSDPALFVDELAIETNRGSIQLAPTSLDLAEGRATFGELLAQLDPRWAAEQAGIELAGTPRAELSASANLPESHVELELALPGWLSAQLAIDSRLGASLGGPEGSDTEVDVTVDVAVPRSRVQALAKLDDEAVRPWPEFLDFQLRVGARTPTTELPSLSSESEAELGLRVEFTCLNCESVDLPLSLRLDATADTELKRGRAELHAELLHTKVDAELRLGGEGLEAQPLDDGELDARLVVDAPALTRTAQSLRPFLDAPTRARLRGSTHLELSCRGPTEPPQLHCELSTRADGVDTLERLRLALSTDVSPNAVSVEVSRLDATAQGLDLQFGPAPARFAYGFESGRVQVGNLNLSVGAPEGDLRIRAKGDIDPEGTSDFEFAVADLDLELVRRFAPGVPLRGRVDLRAELRGEASEPTLALVLDGRGLRFANHEIGELQLETGYQRGRTQTHLRLEGPLAQRLELRAATPAEVNLEQSRFGLPPGSVELDVDLVELDLGSVGALVQTQVDGMPNLAGGINLETQLRGTLRKPRVTVHASGRRITLDDRVMPEFDLALEIDDAPLDSLRTRTVPERGRTLSVDLDLRHSAFDSLRLDLVAPLRLDLQRGVVSPLPGEPHEVNVALTGLDLAEVMTLAEVEAPALAGTLDLGAQLNGDLIAPILAAQLEVGGLSIDEKAVGHLRFDAAYAEGQATLEGEAETPFFDSLQLTASAPLELDLSRGRSEWKSAEPHRLRLGIDGIHPEAAAPWAPELPPLAGRGSAWLRLDGNAEDPRLSLDLAMSEFQFDEARVGDVGVALAYAEGRATADLDLRIDAAKGASLHAESPLQLAPLGPQPVQWDPEAEHRLSFELEGLDDAYLRGFAELPDELALVVGGRVEARGGLSTAHATMDFDGEIESGGLSQPLALDATIDPDAQALHLRLENGAAGRVQLDTELGLTLASVVAGENDLDVTKLDAQLILERFDLAPFSPLLPPDIRELEGRVDSKVVVDGTLASPHFGGSLSLGDGALTVVPLRQRYEDLVVDLRFNDRGATLRKLSLRSGKGSVEATAEAKFDLQNLDAKIDVELVDLPFAPPGVPKLAIDSKIATSIVVNPEGQTIEVHLADTLVDAKSTNVAAPKPIPESGRITFVDAEGIEAAREAKAALEAAKVDDPTPMAFALVLDDPIRIRGPSVDMAWKGGVDAKIRANAVTATGALNCENGTFDLLGNIFKVERGEVTLPKGREIEPFIALEATTQIDEYAITATIRGPAARPTLILSSDPPRPESEIFKMLVTGSADTESADPDQVEAQAASVLAALSSPALQRELNEGLKVDKIGVTFGDSVEEPILSVGKNLSRSVYVETRYHHGASENEGENKAELGLRYRFAPRWSLETFFGTAQAGGADVWWGRSFDVQRRRWWIDPPKGAPTVESQGAMVTEDPSSDPSEHPRDAEAKPSASEGSADPHADGTGSDEKP